ncbi:hypothetical protein ACIBSV_12340 [Embleya sp. NPDC050154]|uniref:hypothetical protein n=1 Tax=unclassified Embleya TaxID=2699296 RepID=UPI0037A85912
MSDYTHDDDLFAMVSDDTIDTLDTADGGTVGAAPLWETDAGGESNGAYPNSTLPYTDPNFDPLHDPNYDPFHADSDGDGKIDMYDPQMFDPNDGNVPPATPSQQWRDDQLANDPYANDPYADPYGDPYADPYGDPYGSDPYGGSDPYADPAGYDPGPAADHGQGVSPQWGAVDDGSGNWEYHAPDNWTPAQFDGFGDPVGDAQYWQQQTSPTSCAVVSQGMILEKLTGVPLDENALMTEAQQAGIYDPETGTRTDDIGKLLEMHGVDTDMVPGADMRQMLDALEKGDQVIVALDAQEIWSPVHDPNTGAPLEQDPTMGHAVWVTGIDTQPDGSVYVLLNDSGAPFGQTEPIPLADFVNAWQDRDTTMIVAHPTHA